MITGLYVRNVLRAADLHAWPVGAAPAVLDLAAAFSRWSVTWSEGVGPGRWDRPGFYAWARTLPGRGVLYRPTAEELRAVIELNPGNPDRWTPPGGWI